MSWCFTSVSPSKSITVSTVCHFCSTGMARGKRWQAENQSTSCTVFYSNNNKFDWRREVLSLCHGRPMPKEHPEFREQGS